MFENLEERAKELLAGLQPQLDYLASNNISLHDATLSTSHIIVTYPPKQVLEKRLTGIELPESNLPKALYIHIPFCTGICTYCGYVRTAKQENDPNIDIYLGRLEKESALFRQKLDVHRIPIESVYIGGGTPTLLTSPQLARLFGMIANDYDLKPGGEYSLEGSPETITVEKIQLAKSLGVNRVSLGVESFNDDILASVHRRHNAVEAMQALRKVQEGGIDNIDLDMMRGLPGYDSGRLIADLYAIRELGLPSITSYQYVMKQKSIDFKRSRGAIAQSQLHHAMFILGMEELGYLHASPMIDCFVKNEGAVYQHNLQKWGQLTDLISLGKGVYGNIGNVQYLNHDRTYPVAIEQGRLPIAQATVLSQEEMMRRHFVMGMKVGVNKNDFRHRHGVDASDSPLAPTIEHLKNVGAIEETPDSFRITLAGQLAAASSVQNKFYSEPVRSLCAAAALVKS